MGYYVMKLFHIFFVVLFLGNIIIAVFWKRNADRTDNPQIIANTMRGVIRADRLFTMPGAIGLLIFGFAALGMAGISFSTPWVLWSFILYVISGVVSMVKVIPIQKKLLAVAEATDFDIQQYSTLSKQWDLWGTIATITPIIAVILMVLKPGL